MKGAIIGKPGAGRTHLPRLPGFRSVGACFCRMVALMHSRFFLFFMMVLAGPLHADDVASRQLSVELLRLTGTAAIFDNPRVQAAVADPMPFLGDAVAARRERLLKDAGFRQWQAPRVWLLQLRTETGVEHWDSLATALGRAAQARGYALVDAQPLPGAEAALSFLAPAKAVSDSVPPSSTHPGLPGLLAAYGADVLVLLHGQQWALWHPAYRRQGILPAAGLDLLPDILAETVAAAQQWPEARSREVVQVSGIGGLADFAAVQVALQALPGAQQVQLIRAGQGQLWFALSAPSGSALGLALDGEPRLAPVRQKPLPLPSSLKEARWLACPLQMRVWEPRAVTKLPGAAAASVQLPAAPIAPSP